MKKNILKFIFSFFAITLFSILGSKNVWADVSVYSNTYETDSGRVTYIETDEVVSHEEIAKIVEEQRQEVEQDMSASAISASWYGLVRNGNTTNCELWFNFSGGIICSNLQYSQIKVQNRSILNRKTYKTFAADIKKFNAGMIKSVYIGAVSIPTSEKSAHIDATNVLLYSLSGGWISVWGSDSNPVIN